MLSFLNHMYYHLSQGKGKFDFTQVSIFYKGLL